MKRAPRSPFEALPRHIDGRLAVIGDVHGQIDQLDRLLANLLKLPDSKARWIVFVGDFLDRGPNPRAALEAVLRLRAEHGRVTAVMGNHDLAIVGALGLIKMPPERNWNERYLKFYDASTTFTSYGAANQDLVDLGNRIPNDHKRFLVDLPWCVEHPAFLVVHAGLVPDQRLDEQMAVLRRRDFTLNAPSWLCDKGLANASPPRDFEKTVISGHVRVPQIRFGDRRILVDTTGGHGGDLSAVLLPEGSVVTSAVQPAGAVSP